MTYAQLLALDLYSNIECFGCGKSLIVKEAIIEGTDIDHLYLVCEFCSHFINLDGSFNWNGVLAQYGIIVTEAPLEAEDIGEAELMDWENWSGYPWV